MKTTTNKTDYRNLPLSQQLERGLELLRQGEYDLHKMMAEWGQYTHPQMAYNPKTDSIEYSYRYGQYPGRLFGYPDGEAQESYSQKDITRFPLLWVEGWNQGPTDGLLPGEHPLDFWTEEEWEEICSEKYDGDYEAWHDDHPEAGTLYNRCAGYYIFVIEEDRDNYLSDAIMFIEAGIAHLKEMEAEESL